MSFGLRNAAQTFQRFIDEVLRDLDFCYAYTNYVLVASNSEDRHDQHLRTLFQGFSVYGVLLNPSKRVFGATEVTFISYTASVEGTWPLEIVAAINHFQQPVLVKDIRRLLGMLNFYQQFIPQAASIQTSLHAALAGPKFKGSQPVDWTPTMAQAFEDCKASLSRATLLDYPDPSATLTLFTEASDIATGAPYNIVSATLVNPWLSTPISSAPLNKSTVRTTASSWQCMRPSSTSDIWPKAIPMSSLRITSLSLMLSGNSARNAHHDSSDTWGLFDNSLLTSGMSRGKKM
jgi:hypothetical protein